MKFYYLPCVLSCVALRDGKISKILGKPSSPFCASILSMHKVSPVMTPFVGFTVPSTRLNLKDCLENGLNALQKQQELKSLPSMENVHAEVMMERETCST